MTPPARRFTNQLRDDRRTAAGGARRARSG
jgi:hypothetical protein